MDVADPFAALPFTVGAVQPAHVGAGLGDVVDTRVGQCADLVGQFVAQLAPIGGQQSAGSAGVLGAPMVEGSLGEVVPDGGVGGGEAGAVARFGVVADRGQAVVQHRSMCAVDGGFHRGALFPSIASSVTYGCDMFVFVVSHPAGMYAILHV